MFTLYPFPLWWLREYILGLIVIIESEVWIIIHCLELGHETVVCAVCLFIYLWWKIGSDLHPYRFPCVNEATIKNMSKEITCKAKWIFYGMHCNCFSIQSICVFNTAFRLCKSFLYYVFITQKDILFNIHVNQLIPDSIWFKNIGLQGRIFVMNGHVVMVLSTHPFILAGHPPQWVHQVREAYSSLNRDQPSRCIYDHQLILVQSPTSLNQKYGISICKSLPICYSIQNS